MNEDFEKDLVSIINKHSVDTFCETPDFIIAAFLCQHIRVLARTNGLRDQWYGFDSEKL